MKMEEVEMSLSFHMWNLQEETVSLAPLVKEQEEFLGVCVIALFFLWRMIPSVCTNTMKSMGLSTTLYVLKDLELQLKLHISYLQSKGHKETNIKILIRVLKQ